MKRSIQEYILLLILLLLSYPIMAQISYGGSPIINTEDFSAEKVLYLLPQEEPLVIEAAKSLKYNQVKKAIQYAVVRDVDLSPEFNGEWVNTEKMRIWRAHIISPQAYSLGVLFSEYNLSDGVRVFIYDESGEHIKGAFTSKNNKDFGSLFVSHIPGEQVIIELQVDNDISDYGKLRVGSVSHAVLPVFSEKKNSGLGESQDCEIDINCEEGEDWQLIKKSVCQIETPRLLCTGTLINNTSYNGTPYILTAEHCINKEVNAQNTVYSFRFENSECFVDDALLDKSISGGSLISTGGGDTVTLGSRIDFSLIELSASPPVEYDLFYSGWDLRGTNYNSSATLHHPNADAMKISYDFDPMETADPESIPGDLNDYFAESNYWIKQWDIGTTEGGSSGSPLFNPNQRLIGVLSGGLAFCGDSIGYNAETNRIIFGLSPNADDYYSRFYFGWDYFEHEERQLKKWLDPKGTGLLSLNGISQLDVAINNDITIENRLTVYPNPSRGELKISIPGHEFTELDIEVYGITGNLMHKEIRSSQGAVHLKLNHLETGIYFIRLSNEKFSASSRFLIQR